MPPVPQKQTMRPVPQTSNGKVSIIDRIKPVKSRVESIMMSLYGRPKTGKTRLACTFPKPLLIIGSEDGTASVVGVKGVKFVQLDRTDEIHELAEGPLATSEYATVVLDNGTKLRDMRIAELWESRGGAIPARKPFIYADKAWKEVWTQCSNDMKSLMRPILNLGRRRVVNVVVIAHEQNFSDDSGQSSDLIIPSVGPALGKAVCDWLNAECDYIGQTLLRPKMVEKEQVIAGKVKKIMEASDKNEYCLRVAPHEIYQAGFRVPIGRELKEDFVVDPTYDKIIKLING